MRAAPTEVFSRSVPAGVSRSRFTASIAPRMSPSAGAMRATNCSPAADSATLRVVRLNSRTPSRASSPATALPKAEVDMPMSVAAARKLPCRATASTASSSTRPDLCIVLIPGTSREGLASLSNQ